MIPILFQKDELNFTSNGLGRLVDMVDCEVSEELNGPYEIEFQYPIGGALFDYMIENGGVVYSTHDDAGDFQAFDIDGHTTPIDGLVTFRGKHISYRLNKYVINPFTASSCAAAMAAIKPNSQPGNMQFSFWTDKSVNGNFELTHPVSARAILGGAEGSILDVYGKGEYKFNNFNVMLYTNRGIDSGVTIRYGKNLLDLNREYDTSETYTAIAPYWEKEGVTVYVPGLYVLSSNNVQTEDLPWTDQDGNPILGTDGEPIYFRAAKIEPVPMDFTDAFEEAPTPEVLAQKAREYLDRNKPWLPNENIEIDFVALWQTPEYENVAALQRLSLGDKASVYYPEVNLVCEHQKIIKTVYGPLEEKYRRMEFGNLKSGLGETIIDNETNTIVAIVNSVIQSTPALQAAITHATELIRGGLGGHVVIKTNAQGEPEELLIMDTDDVATAVNVWRFNQGGLGHSHSGYNGPYDDVALTMDGRINASMITAGVLNAVLIQAGVLSDQAGKNYWNMETGEFVTKSLKATDYVYVNGGTGSYFNIPLVSGANWSSRYFRLSTDSTKPLLFHAHDDTLNQDVDIYMNTNGFHYSQGTYNVDVNAYGVCIIWGSSSTKIDYSGVKIYDSATPSGTAPCNIDSNSLVFRDSSANKIVSIAPYYSSGKHAFIIRDSSGNVFAKLGPSYSSGEAELQLGGTTLTESQLQRLLALI